MITARLLTVLAASSLASIAYGQATQPAPSSNPNAAPGYNATKPHERRMTTVEGANESAPPEKRNAPGSALTGGQTQTHAATIHSAEAGPAGHSWSNMPVQSESGQSLGSVSSVVPGLNGEKTSGYVVVSGADGKSVPVPYRTANSMVRDGELVLSQSRFEHAPKVTQEDLQNNSDHAWRAKADRYWEHKGSGHMEK